MNKLIKILLASFTSLFFSFSAFAGGHYTGPDLSGQKVVMFGPGFLQSRKSWEK